MHEMKSKNDRNDNEMHFEQYIYSIFKSNCITCKLIRGIWKLQQETNKNAQVKLRCPRKVFMTNISKELVFYVESLVF